MYAQRAVACGQVERWLGLPKDGKIDYKKSRGWDFPDQTVIVKSLPVCFST